MNIRTKPSETQSQEAQGVFDDYAAYYDLLYRDKDYQAEADYVASLIKRFQPKTQSILELGSGTGIHAGLLAVKGFLIHGIERSAKMLQRSWELAEIQRKDSPESSLTFTEGDIRTTRLPQSFDAVMALFHVISYQATNEDVTAAFETARYHLSQGGIFIFDVWYGPAVLTQRPSVRIKRMIDAQTEITRIAEPVLHPNENLVDVNYHVFIRNLTTNDVQELKETHAMRYFFKPEIERITSQTAFCLCHTEEWLTGSPIGHDTWGVCFILQAK